MSDRTNWFHAWLLGLIILLASIGLAEAQTTPSRAWAFQDTIGTNGYVDGQDSQYTNNLNATIADAQYIGATKWRNPFVAGQTAINGYVAMANAGFQFSFTPPGENPLSVPDYIGWLHTLVTAMGSAAPIRWLEGPNEPDGQGGAWMPTVTTPCCGVETSWQGIAHWMPYFYQQIKADSILSGVQIASQTDTFAENPNVGLQYATVPSGGGGSNAPGGTKFYDVYNFHDYPEFNNHAVGMIDPNSTVKNGVHDIINERLGEEFVTTATNGYAGNSLSTVLAAPIIYTEWNWTPTDIPNTTKRGIATTNAYLVGFSKGLDAMFQYALYPNGDVNQLFDGQGQPTVAATLLHNLTTILHDPASNAKTFATAALNVTVSGLPSDGMWFLLQKASGHYQVVLWRNTTNSNNSSGAPITIPPVNVTVTVGSSSSLARYDILSGTSPVSTSNGTAVTVPLADSAQIVDVSGSTGSFVESADQTTVTSVGPTITDANGNTFAISSSNQVSINGTPDTATSNVVELAYVNHTVWQKNTAGNWYSYNGTPGSYNGPTTTSPLAGTGPPASGLAPVPAPLTGTVTPSAWVAVDSNYPGITLACGKPFHYILAQPPQYSPTLYKYPLYIWLHPTMSGNKWYLGQSSPTDLPGGEANDFNTQAFQTRHPAFYVAPMADQTNGNGSPNSCNGSGDDAVENWGGWFNNGSTGSGTHYSGDTGPNTFAILAMINELESKYSIDPARIYINGFSLGGIYTDYACLHYNAFTGDKGKIFAACAGEAGVNQADSPPSNAAIAAMTNVPQWMFSGSGDSASPPGSWNTPLCSGLGGNPNALSAITSASANQCGTSAMRYTLCPSCGHQDTDANGNGVWSNQIINDFLFAQTAPVSGGNTGGGGGGNTGTGQFVVKGGQIYDPKGRLYIPVGINLESGEQSSIAVTNAQGQPLTTLFPGINHIRLRTQQNNDSQVLQAGGSYPDPTTFDDVVNKLTALGIVVEIEDHSCNGGRVELSSGASNTTCAPPQPGSAAFTPMANWWAALATHFKSNPYVWFGSLNEPCSDSNCSYGRLDLIAGYHQGMYNAIRNTGSTGMIQLLAGIGGGNCQTVGAGPFGSSASVYSPMTNIIWELHSYRNDGDTNANNGVIAGSASQACGYNAAQTIQSKDGIVPVIFGEWGSGDGDPNNGDGSQMAAGMIAAAKSSVAAGNTGWSWYTSNQWHMVENGFTAGGPFSLTTWGQQMANVIAQIAPLSGGGGTPVETLAVNTIASVTQNTAFTVTGTISNATAAPSLQYQDNGGSWTALPSGSTVTASSFSFTNPGLPANGAATVSVRDANNNSITATSASFVVRAPESANNTTAVPGTQTVAPTFSDTFASLPLHNAWQSGDNWQLVAPDTPAGRGGPNFGENGDQWWVNPFNTNTQIANVYTRDASGLHLALIATPSGQQSYINNQAGATLPYVAGLLNTSQTNYQKYGYWEIKASVPKLAGFTFQADTECVQVCGTWPPEIDLRIGTDASGVQTVLFEFALGGGQYTKYTAPTTFDPTSMHTYGWDWESDFITFYIDGVQMYQAANPSTAYTTNPMFLFLATAANYIGNTGDPAVGSLPVNATVKAVNIYPSRPGGANGASASIVDASGNVFFITAGKQVSINGVVDTTTSNVIELAYVNHVLWQENAAGNWYSYNGSPGSYNGPTTTSPLTGVAETLAVNAIGGQTANIGFTVSGSISGVSAAPSLQYQDNAGAWTALPAGSTVSTTAFSFAHPALSAGQYVVNIRDASATGITAASNTFSVAAAGAETISVNTIATQSANTPFTVTGSISGSTGSAGSTDFAYNPGQDGSFWKQPFQSSANWITSGPLITALRSGTPSINVKGNYGVPWVVGTASDPLVQVTDGTRSINVHIPLGTIIETPTSSFDQTIGGTDKTQPYLVWSISGATMNTGSVQSSGSVINGTYGMAIQDGAGLLMVDQVTGTPGTNNSLGGIQDYELGQISSDPNYVIQKMLAFQMDENNQASTGLVWPLKITDTSNGSYSGPIPQGITIGIPANIPMPTGKSRAFKALWDQLQQFGMFNYNFGATGGVNFVVYDQSGAYSQLVSDLQAAWKEIGQNYIAILNYNNGVSGAQYSLATTKGATPGSTNAFPAPAPLDLSPTGGVNVAPSTFGAWYPNTSYTATPTNPGASVPTLQYQDGSGAWQPLPASAVVSGNTFSFTHPGMASTSSGKVSVRDANNNSAVGSSNTFVVSGTPVETLAINTIATQQANVPFTVGGSIGNATSVPSLQYQDSGGAWQALPSGATVTTTSFSFSHPGIGATSNATVAVRDASSTGITAASNSFAILLGESANNTVVTTVGPVVVDASGEAFAINSSGQITVNGVVDTTTSNVVVLAYVNHLVWQKNAAGNWYSKPSAAAAWTGPTTTSPLPPETLAISNIGAQVSGVSFAVSGTIANALAAPTLQYSVSNGPWVAFPTGSQVSITAYSLTIPGITTTGTATVSVRDAGTPTITTTSNTFSIAAAPAEQLAFASIPAQQVNMAFRVTGTIVNASTIPTLQYNVNGGAWLALPSGSPASLVTQTSFAFTVPGISASGATTVGVRDANNTAVTASSNTFQVGVPAGETLSINTVVGQLAGTAFTISGVIGNATVVPTLQYQVNSGGWVAWPAANSPITLTSFQLAVPGQAAGATTISVRDATTTTVTATSNSFTIAPIGNEGLTINAIPEQPVGTAFVVNGKIINLTSPPTLQYSDNGGSFQPLPAGSAVTATTFSFTHPGMGASNSVTVVVRDANHTSVQASAPAFIVIARESANLTTVTVPGPQIVDSHGNAWTITAGKQVALNGVAQVTTNNVIELAYVNRQVWYENKNLNWFAFSSVGTWTPTGGTPLGPLPSSKVNIYLTSTARLAVVTGFAIKVPGIVVNDTVVAGTFAAKVTATNGVVTMPGATGAGSTTMTESGTLAVINSSLAALQYIGKTIGNGVVSITVTDPAKSVAAANVNIAVVRAAPVIPRGQ